MHPSPGLQELMRFGMSQQLCDEIDAAFRATEQLQGRIDVLERDVASYRGLWMQKSVDSNPGQGCSYGRS